MKFRKMSSGAMISTSPYKRQNLGVHNQMPTLVRSDGSFSSKPRSRNSSANSTPSRAGSTPPSRQGNKASKSSKSNKSRSENSPSASVSSSRAPPSSSSVQVETSVDHDSPQASSQTSSQKSHKKSHTFIKRRSQSLQQSTANPKSSAKAKLKVQRSVDENSTSSNPNLMNGEREISEMREKSREIPEAELKVRSQSKSLIAHPIKSSTASNQPSSHMIEQTNHVTTNDVEYHNTSHNNIMSRGDGISESMENTQQIADVDSHEHKDLLYSLDLSKTEDRLKTLKWWPLTSLTREELASNGYFYLGNEDRTQCYFCKIVVRNWGENADVSQYHHDNCTMKQDQQETNQQATTTTRAIQQPSTEDTPTETPPTSRIEQASGENTTAVTSAQQQATTTRIIQQASTEDTPTETPPTRTTTQPQQQASAQVSQVSEEEESENNDVTNVMTSSTSRMMQCHDDTDDEDEVLIDEDIEITPNEDPLIAEMNRDIYPCESPAVATMKKLDARSDSFAHEEWQGDELYFTSVAESGFFYLGSSDIVRCWYCGVHLTNWYWEGVDAWKCHATANHACEYLKRNRSSQFIEHAINNPEPTPAQLQEEEEAQQRATTSTEVERIIPLVFSRSAPLPEYVPDTRPKEVQDREEFEGAMEKEPVKEALSMGYEREEIELVLKLQITQHGVAYQSYEGLLAAILDHRDVHH